MKDEGKQRDSPCRLLLQSYFRKWEMGNPASPQSGFAAGSRTILFSGPEGFFPLSLSVSLSVSGSNSIAIPIAIAIPRKAPSSFGEWNRPAAGRGGYALEWKWVPGNNGARSSGGLAIRSDGSRRRAKRRLFSAPPGDGPRIRGRRSPRFRWSTRSSSTRVRGRCARFPPRSGRT